MPRLFDAFMTIFLLPTEMPAFTYTALSPSGQQVTGKLAVGSRAEAFRKLEAQSLTPVKVVEDAKWRDRQVRTSA